MPWENLKIAFPDNAGDKEIERRKPNSEYYDNDIDIAEEEDIEKEASDPYRDNLDDERERQEADKIMKRTADAKRAAEAVKQEKEMAVRKDRKYRRLAGEYTRKIIKEIESKDPSLRRRTNVEK